MYYVKDNYKSWSLGTNEATILGGGIFLYKIYFSRSPESSLDIALPGHIGAIDIGCVRTLIKSSDRPS
jgi:hypothetical protein